MPLTSTEIKIRLLKKGKTISVLAREWSAELGYTIYPENISRVIYRRVGFAQPLIRQKLAKFLGVSVSQIGRDPLPRGKKKQQQPARAA